MTPLRSRCLASWLVGVIVLAGNAAAWAGSITFDVKTTVGGNANT